MLSGKDAGPKEWTRKNVEGVAKATYVAKEDGELSLKKGDQLIIVDVSINWARVKIGGKIGMVPVAYVGEAHHEEKTTSQQMLMMLDNMFEEAMSNTVSENEEDEEAAAQRAAQEAEFSFDAIFEEVMTEKRQREGKSQTVGQEDNRDETAGPNGLAKSTEAVAPVKAAKTTTATAPNKPSGGSVGTKTASTTTATAPKKPLQSSNEAAPKLKDLPKPPDSDDDDDDSIPLPNKPLPSMAEGDMHDDDDDERLEAPPPVKSPRNVVAQPVAPVAPSSPTSGRAHTAAIPSSPTSSRAHTASRPTTLQQKSLSDKSLATSPTPPTITSPRRTANPAATAAVSSVSANNSSVGGGGVLRKSANPPVSVPTSPLRTTGGSTEASSSAGTSPQVSRSNARPIAKLLNDDGTYRCAKCNTTVGKEATFCKHCGSSLKQAAAEVCTKCKFVLKPGVTVCGQCGTRASFGQQGGAGEQQQQQQQQQQQSPPAAKSPRGGGGGDEGSKFLASPDPAGAQARVSGNRLVSVSSASQPQGPTIVRGSSRSTTKVSPRPTSPGNGNTGSPPTAHAGGTRASSIGGAANDEKTRMILVGTGSSGGTPHLGCLATSRCKACVDALQPGSRNRRRNPSMLIQHKGYNILIDCGKSFREGWIEVIEKYRVTDLHAIVITHAHADAFFGLDDLREVIGFKRAIPVYATEKDLASMAQTMPYLFDSAKATGSHLVSQIVGMPIPASGIFEVFGLRIQALPVPHGPDCVSQAFMIGPVLYMSDVSEVPSTIFEHVAALPNPLKVLIIDCISIRDKCKAHLTLPEALAAIKELKPERALLTGCGHDFFYQEISSMLKKVCVKEQMHVKMGYDLLSFLLPTSLF